MLTAMAAALSGCSADDDNAITEQAVTASVQSSCVVHAAHTSDVIHLEASRAWRLEFPDSLQITASPQEGTAGSYDVRLSTRRVNNTNDTIVSRGELAIYAENGITRKGFSVKVAPSFVLERNRYEPSGEGDTVRIVFRTEFDMAGQDAKAFFSGDIPEMWEQLASSRMDDIVSRGEEERLWQLEMVITPNRSGRIRQGIFHVGYGDDGTYQSEAIQIVQMPAGFGTSTDFSMDREARMLQKHTKGVGIPVVFMGDGYLDTDHASGRYMQHMQKGYDALFSREPMKSYRDYFDVYCINAVSLNNVFGEDSSTAFSTLLLGGTTAMGKDEVCLEYAAEAVRRVTGKQPSEKDMQNMMAVCLLNTEEFVGTTNMQLWETDRDVPVGASIAYLTCADGDSPFDILITHEVVGHGLGKMADEYGYSENGNLNGSPDALATILSFHETYHAYTNVVTAAEKDSAPWLKFASDSRYSNEKMGMYEGGYTFTGGVWRSTDNSIMNSGTCFSAICREILFRRIMDMASEGTYSYSYEDFVKFDAPARACYVNETGKTRAVPGYRRMPAPNVSVK